MKKKSNGFISVCTDCGNTTEVNKNGICAQCARRKANMKARQKEYIPYIQLSEAEKKKINTMRETQEQIKMNKLNKSETNINISQTETNFDHNYYINMLRDCGCEIPDDNLINTLNILSNTNKLKNILMVIVENENQQALLDLEQALNVVERKLQHNWEYNGFQEDDDVKFKKFLSWRRDLKSAIFFWKKLYQTNTIIELQRAWNAYITDPNDKILLSGDKMNSTLKRFQITTESISTIFNTKRPFTRVFYAQNKDSAYIQFVKWMTDRNLHENPKKTVITELNNDGEKPKEENENG